MNDNELADMRKKYDGSVVRLIIQGKAVDRYIERFGNGEGGTYARAIPFYYTSNDEIVFDTKKIEEIDWNDSISILPIPDSRFVNTVNGVYFIVKSASRQWKRGIMRDSVSAYDLFGSLVNSYYNDKEYKYTEKSEWYMPNRFWSNRQENYIYKILDGTNTSISLSEAISLLKNKPSCLVQEDYSVCYNYTQAVEYDYIFCYRTYPIAFIKDKVLIPYDGKLFYQEVKDFLNRTYDKNSSWLIGEKK